MTTANGKQQCLTEVFPTELDESRRRRATVHLDASALDEASQPAAALGLGGLALAGGGIRSATISSPSGSSTRTTTSWSNFSTGQ
jgi:hypothetical protein